MTIDEGHLDKFFTPLSYFLLTMVSLMTALAGLLCNSIIIAIFTRVYKIKRFQSVLWVNLSICLIAQSLVMIFDALGVYVTALSNTGFACVARYALPLAMDQVFMGSYLSLLTERMTIIHFAPFHGLIPQLDTPMILYGWSYGTCFVFLVYNNIIQKTTPKQCLSPFMDQIPQEPVSFLLFSLTTLATLFSLISAVLTVPNGASKVEKLRREIERRGVTIVLIIGSAYMFIGIPRQTVTLLYWMDRIGVLQFQVSAQLCSMIQRLSVLLPFVALCSRSEFRSGVTTILTFKSLEQVRKKIQGQENYLESVHKLADTERKEADKKLKNKGTSAASINEEPHGSHVELRPRYEFTLETDEFISMRSSHV